MSIKISPEIQLIRDNAYKAKYALDQRTKLDAFDIDAYFAHMRDRYNNYTKAMIAHREVHYQSIMLPEVYRINKEYVENINPEMVTLRKSIEDKVNKLYPKTRAIREYIIEKGRLCLDKVTPSKGYNIFNRIAIKMLSKKYM